MHRPIRDRLEDLLKIGRSSREASEHLASCAECTVELEIMRQQRDQFAALRVPEMAPDAGFYARVRQRIEEQETGSFWSFLIESPFGKRLAIGSFTVALALGSYVISQESRHRPQVESSMIALNGEHNDAPVMGSQDEQRDAVLENFVVHNVGLSRGQAR